MSRAHDDDFTAFAAAAVADLRRTAFLMCGDWQRAEDTAQEALIRVYQSWERVRRRESLLAYARRTAVRILIDDARRPSRRESPGRVDVGSPQVAGPHTEVAERDAMLTALAALPPRRRACVVLRYYHDLSVADTAQALGCSEGTVKSQTSAALATLRGLLDREQVDLGSPR